MNIKSLTAGFLAMLMMGGAAYAMDSEAIEKHMEEINQKADAAADQDRVEALEQQVQDLQELIQMMLEEEQAS
ncbi:hypothetical protein [Halomonas nitroreducens]|uniref:Uncharacterized protein n=1 Tax=Halomonas nitroreducens TaxID=447425 RepID=A0A3S0K0I4_9GAMM|nr:hypothetical protein [Halomonas nitroreducens]RTR07216.1 hypothetical protein EKG36_01845 [Halomonas nitroreducens]